MVWYGMEGLESTSQEFKRSHVFKYQAIPCTKDFRNESRDRLLSAVCVCLGLEKSLRRKPAKAEPRARWHEEPQAAAAEYGQSTFGDDWLPIGDHGGSCNNGYCVQKAQKTPLARPLGSSRIHVASSTIHGASSRIHGASSRFHGASVSTQG